MPDGGEPIHNESPLDKATNNRHVPAPQRNTKGNNTIHPPFLHRRRVAFAETDLTGGLHFANLLRYFEEAEQALFRELGIPMLWRSDDGMSHGWPRVSAECDLLEPICLADELDILVRVDRVRHSSAQLKFEVQRAGQTIALGGLRLACIEAKPGQPMRAAAIPEEISLKLRALVET